MNLRAMLRKEGVANPPLEADALPLAWARSRVTVPTALRERALAICLRCLADAMRRRSNR